MTSDIFKLPHRGVETPQLGDNTLPPPNFLIV